MHVIGTGKSKLRPIRSRQVLVNVFATLPWLLCALANLAWAEGQALRPPSAAIKVDVHSDLGSVNRLILGNNSLGYLHGPAEYSAKGAGVWDPVRQAPEPELVQLAKDAGITALRWPGGCNVHEFNWKQTVGPLESRPRQAFGLAEFLKVAEDIGAAPVITMADYWGDEKDAADLVEYLNAPQGTNPNGGIAWAAVRASQGHPQPYGVRWFEFGNETSHGNHTLATPTYSVSSMSPGEYARRLRALATAMKSVDPDVRIGAVIGFETSFPLSPWTETVLRETANTADFYIYHAYLPILTQESGGPPPDALFELGFAANEQFESFFRHLRTEIRRVSGRNIPLAVTEYNGYYVQERPERYRFSLGAAVQVADLVIKMLDPGANVALANYWHMANEYWGMIKGYRPPYTLRPAYHVYRLFHEHLGEQLLASETTSGFFRTSGGNGVLRSGKAADSLVVSPPKPVGLPWNISFVPGASASADGSGVLTVSLNSWDINFYQARIPISVVPGFGYRVTAEIRAKGFVKSGARLEVIDDRGWTATKSSTLSPPVRSGDWTPVVVDYVPLADAKGIEIRARRQNANEEGQFEVRNVQLQTYRPAFVERVPSLSSMASSDAEKVSVFIVNRNVREQTRVRIEGLPSGSIQAWTLSGTSIDGTNEDPRNTTIAPRQIPVAQDKTAVLVTLPPHSFSVVRASVGRARNISNIR